LEMPSEPEGFRNPGNGVRQLHALDDQLTGKAGPLACPPTLSQRAGVQCTEPLREAADVKRWCRRTREQEPTSRGMEAGASKTRPVGTQPTVVAEWRTAEQSVDSG
jgi:hypothetical protein